MKAFSHTRFHLTLAAVLVMFSLSQAHADEGHFDYDHQSVWQEVHGDRQSPIAIESAQAMPDIDDDDDDTIKVDGSVRDATVVDNTHTIQVNVLPGSFATIRGRRFQLQQFHFHTPSEHTLNGVHYPLEAHFVYRAKDGRLAVLGVMFREGEANPAFTEIMQRVVPHGRAEPIVSFDISRLLPDNKSYYHYLGSLTTPPLSQNLEWYILPQPVTLSAMQIAGFHRHYTRNNRDLQPRNDRELLYFADK